MNPVPASTSVLALYPLGTDMKNEKALALLDTYRDRIPEAVVTQLQATLPEVGEHYPCPYCGWVTHVPLEYSGMWIECGNCGGI